MDYRLIPGINLDYSEGAVLDYNPIFLLDGHTIFLTPITDRILLEKNMADWIGSNPWLLEDGDAILFAFEDLSLKFAYFIIPEINQAISNWDFIEKSRKKIGGILKLKTQFEPFELNSMLYRDYSIQKDALICYNDLMDITDGDLDEITITRDFSLLFCQARYCGWKLSNPELHIADELSAKLPEPADSDNFVKSCLLVAMILFDKHNFELMSEQNEDFLNELSNFHKTIQRHNHISNPILNRIANWIFEVSKSYYSDDQVKKAF